MESVLKKTHSIHYVIFNLDSDLKNDKLILHAQNTYTATQHYVDR